MKKIKIFVTIGVNFPKAFGNQHWHLHSWAGDHWTLWVLVISTGGWILSIRFYYYTVTHCNFSNQCKTMSIRQGGPTDRSRYYSCVIDDLVKGATIFSFRFIMFEILLLFEFILHQLLFFFFFFILNILITEK